MAIEYQTDTHQEPYKHSISLRVYVCCVCVWSVLYNNDWCPFAYLLCNSRSVDEIVNTIMMIVCLWLQVKFTLLMLTQLLTAVFVCVLLY